MIVRTPFLMHILFFKGAAIVNKGVVIKTPRHIKQDRFESTPNALMRIQLNVLYPRFII